jgi:hypothetical protein
VFLNFSVSLAAMLRSIFMPCFLLKPIAT